MSVEIKLRGLDRLMHQLRRLEKKDAKKALRTGLRKASNLIRKEARRRAPRDDGGYARSLRTKTLRLRKGESAARKVGPGKGGRHGVLIERGTRSRVQKSTGRSTGRMPALRVLEKAHQATKQQAERILRTELQKAVDKVI